MKSLRITTVFLGAAGAAALTTMLSAAPQAPANQGAAIPRLADGKPDFSGTWERDAGGLAPKRAADGSVCILCPATPPPGTVATGARVQLGPRGPERPKYKPEFVAKVKMLDEKQVEFDPALRCGNPGLPRIGAPDVFVSTPGQIVLLYSDLSGAAFRVIPTDGRPHRKDAEETYLGDSVGKWEGDTLVIESVKFVEDTWLIDDGSFHTKDLRVVERIRFNNGKIEYQATAHDPAVLAEPWEMRMRTLKRSDKPVSEPLPCVDRDIDHIVDGTNHDNAR